MSSSDLFQIVGTLIKQTEKAILVEIDDGEEIWIPRSIIEDYDGEFEEDEICIEVPMWFAKKNNLQ